MLKKVKCKKLRKKDVLCNLRYLQLTKPFLNFRNQEHIITIKNSIKKQQAIKAEELQALQNSVAVLNNIKMVLFDLSSRNNEINDLMFQNTDFKQVIDDASMSCENFLKVKHLLSSPTLLFH